MATLDNTSTAGDSAAPAEEPSIREALETAFSEAPEGAQRSDDPPARADSGAPARDDRGRFAPGDKPAAAQPAGAPAAQPGTPGPNQAATRAPVADAAAGQTMPPAPGPAELKAPASWKPQAREKWGAVDPEVRAEIHRRENEHQHTMQQAAGARQFVDAFERVVRPYELFIRAENSTPLDAVDNLMRMAATMRTGSPSQKVDVVASIINQWGVDLRMLDSTMAAHLQGQPAPQYAGGGQQAMRDPRVDQILAQQAQQQRDAQQYQSAQHAQEISAFGSDAKNEFFEDVRVVMADLMQMAAQRGQVLSMADAYAKACQLDENVSKILTQRASARNAGANTQAALRAKRAAASVKGDTTLHDGATVPKNDSIRASLEAAFEESERRA